MSSLDKINLGLSLSGIGITFVLSLLPDEWRKVHKTVVTIGYMIGGIFIGVGIFLFFLSTPAALPPGVTMLPKASMVLGCILFIGGAIWQFSPSGNAQIITAVPSHTAISAAQDAPGELTETGRTSQATGVEITGNSQGGPAAEVIGNGQGGVASEVRVSGCPGQSVTGLRVTQNGPGTGLSVVQTGPGVGMRVVVGIGGPSCDRN